MASDRQPQPKPSQLLCVIEGGVASMSAVFFSQPFEAVKVRCQLDGELSKKSASQRVYKSTGHAFSTMLRTEGFSSFYRGVSASLLHQATMNSVRIGTFDSCAELYTRHIFGGDASAPPTLGVMCAAAVTTGVLGSICGSPANIVKTRFQAGNVPGSKSSLGAQHNYTSLAGAIKDIYAKAGVRGFFVGLPVGVARTAVGSGAQLPAYEIVKRTGVDRYGCDPKDVRLHACSAFAAACAIVLFMTPLDTATVRCWTGAATSSYSNSPVQVLRLIVQTEGVFALWKGAVPLLFRTAPHSLCTFIVLEFLRKQRAVTADVAPFLFSDG